MSKRRFHFIKRRKHTILYDVENMELYSGDNKSDEDLRLLKRQLIATSGHPETQDTTIITEDDNIGDKMRVHRITVCVSNDCNLRCTYCYAKGGSYGKKRNFMTEKTAESFVSFCMKNFYLIDNILFFGGEPLLNCRIIEYICNLFKRQSLRKSCKVLSFSVITNGTLCNDRIIKLLRDNISFITVSIDGNKLINDKNRVFKNGDGCFDRIEYFIAKCKDGTFAKLQYEATYTFDHIDLGISRFDVNCFLNTKFGIKGIVVDEDSLGRKMIYEHLRKLTFDDLLNSNFECLPVDFWQVASNIIKKSPHRFCGIFDDRITITSDGDIVGCQMLIGHDHNIVSNIYDPNAIWKIRNRARNYKDNLSCNECWCYSLCGGCVIQKFYSKKDKQLKTIPDYESCLLTKLYIEEILYLLFEIRTDKTLWPLFIEKVRVKFNT